MSFEPTARLRYVQRIVATDMGGGPGGEGFQQLCVDSETGKTEWRTIETVIDDSHFVAKWGIRAPGIMASCHQLLMPSQMKKARKQNEEA